MLSHVAEMVKKNGRLSRKTMQMLLLGSDIEEDWALDELGRWVNVLAEASVTTDPGEREMLQRALMLRGIPEAAAMLAIATVAGASDTQSVPPRQRLLASVERLDFGILSPGQGAALEFEVQGGPGQIVVENDQVHVTPRSFGFGTTRVRVEAKPMQEGVLWSSLRLVTAGETLELTMVAQWVEVEPPVAAELAPFRLPDSVSPTTVKPMPSTAPKPAPPVPPKPASPTTASAPFHQHSGIVSPKPSSALTLRGNFMPPNTEAKGMMRRLGRGELRQVLGMGEELVLVIYIGGASLYDLRGAECLWDVDSPEARCGAISPDRKVLALGSAKSIQLWDMRFGRLSHRLVGHTKTVTTVTFSPDGCMLASGSQDGTVRMWDISSGREINRLAYFDRAVRQIVEVHENYQYSYKSHAYFSTNTYIQRRPPQTAGITSITFSPDGRKLAVGCWDMMFLCDVDSGHLVYQRGGRTYAVNSVIFSTDGTIVASASDDGTVSLWETVGGGLFRQLQGYRNTMPSGMAFSPDGRILASATSSNSIALLGTDSGRAIRWLEGHTDRVLSIAFDPDGRSLLSGSQDGTVRLWDIAEGREVCQMVVNTPAVTSVIFTSSGYTLASGHRDAIVRLWDTSNGRELKQLKGHTDSIHGLAYNPSTHTLASLGQDGVVNLWDASSGRKLEWTGGQTSKVLSLAFSPDGCTLALGSWSGKVYVHNSDNGQEAHCMTGHLDRVTSTAFHPDGHMLASGSYDKSIRLWDMVNRRKMNILMGHAEPVMSVAFSPDGHILASGSWDGTVRLWEVKSGKELRVLDGHTLFAELAVAFSPDGRKLASVGGDNMVRIWDVTSGRPVYHLTGHAGLVNSVAFGPDGSTLASASEDGTVRLWRLQ